MTGEKEVPSIEQQVQLPPGKTIFDFNFTGMETDDEGRPLLESRSRPTLLEELVTKGVPMETMRCPYTKSPSRYHHRYPMDVSALEQVRRQRYEIQSGMAYIREQYRAWSGGFEPSISDIKAVGYAIAHIPLYLFHRVQDPLSQQGQLPAFIAGMVKSIEGINSLLRSIGRSSRHHDIAPTPELLLQTAEDTKLLVGDHGRVCAASPNLILSTTHFLLEGQPEGYVAHRLDDFLPDFQTFFDFSHNVGFFWDDVDSLSVKQRSREQVIDYSLRREGLDVLIAESLAGTIIDERNFIDHLNYVEPRINQILQRGVKSEPVTAEDVYRYLHLGVFALQEYVVAAKREEQGGSESS